VRPQTAIPDNFKEIKGWKQAQPRDNLLSGKWWEVFNDARLNLLEEQVVSGNQSIAQAEAQYRQAQDLVRSAQSAYFPTSTITGTTNRFRAASGQNVAVSGVKTFSVSPWRWLGSRIYGAVSVARLNPMKVAPKPVPPPCRPCNYLPGDAGRRLFYIAVTGCTKSIV